jgi:heat shock protein HslJ
VTARLTASALAFVAAIVTGLGAGAGVFAAQATPEGTPSPPGSTLAPVVWQLRAIESAGNPTVVPDDPARYTIQFLEDGTLAVQADCNRGSGTFTQSGFGLEIPPFALTMAACGPDSLDGQYVLALNEVAAFAYARDALVLILRDGKGALVFTPALTGVLWTWQGLVGGSTPVAPDDPSLYTITFGDDGRVGLQADCNRGMGGYTVDGSQIEIGPLATTRVACPPGSLFDVYILAVEAADSFTFAEGRLLLILPNDAGTLVFTATSAEAEPATPAAG